MKALFRLLTSAVSFFQFGGAVLGSVAGFSILLLTVQFNEDLDLAMNDEKDLLEPEYIVVNKKIGLAGTLGLAKSGFSPTQMKGLRSQSFIADLAPFTSNQFKVSAFTERTETFPSFYTELFFEAVPDDYLDLVDVDWRWRKGQEEIPIVVPKDYLALYNFGFAQSQGLPQLTSGMIGLVTFKVKITGAGGSQIFDGRVAGFSDRLNTILVPQKFMDWANETYGGGQDEAPTRLILVAKDPSDPQLATYLEDNAYETRQQQLKSSRLNELMQTVLTVVGGGGSVILLLAFFIFVLSFQLLIQRSAPHLRQLIKIGYHYGQLAAGYVVAFLLLMLTVVSVSFIVLFKVRALIIAIFEGSGFHLSDALAAETHTIAFWVFLGLFLGNSSSILIQLRRMAS